MSRVYTQMWARGGFVKEIWSKLLGKIESSLELETLSFWLDRWIRNNPKALLNAWNETTNIKKRAHPIRLQTWWSEQTRLLALLGVFLAHFTFSTPVLWWGGKGEMEKQQGLDISFMRMTPFGGFWYRILPLAGVGALPFPSLSLPFPSFLFPSFPFHSFPASH